MNRLAVIISPLKTGELLPKIQLLTAITGLFACDQPRQRHTLLCKNILNQKKQGV